MQSALPRPGTLLWLVYVFFRLSQQMSMGQDRLDFRRLLGPVLIHFPEQQLVIEPRGRNAWQTPQNVCLGGYHVTSYELTHYKKMVWVWKTKSVLFCLGYDRLIVSWRQNQITFIFIKMMSHNLLVQMAYCIGHSKIFVPLKLTTGTIYHDQISTLALNHKKKKESLIKLINQ